MKTLDLHSYDRLRKILMRRWMSVPEIREEIGLHRRRVYRWLERMSAQGLVVKKGSGPGTAYRLVENPEDLFRDEH